MTRVFGNELESEITLGVPFPDIFELLFQSSVFESFSSDFSAFVLFKGIVWGCEGVSVYCPQKLAEKGFQGWDKSGLHGMDLQACLAVAEKGSMPWKLWGIPPISAVSPDGMKSQGPRLCHFSWYWVFGSDWTAVRR